MADSYNIDREEGPNRKKLSQRVTNFNTFFNTIDRILCVIDLKGCIVEVNKKGLDILEYSIEELRGKNANIIFSPEFQKEIAKQYSAVIEKETGTWNYPLRTRTGRTINSEISFHKGTWDEQDTLFVVAKDISDEMMISEAREVSLRIIVEGIKGEPDDISKKALEETVRLTGSTIGFFGEYEETTSVLNRLIWDYDTRVFPDDILPESLSMAHTKEWREKISLKKPILFAEDQFFNMGEGAGTLKNGLVVPLVEEGEIKYLVGLGNKSVDYGDLDMNLISILWDNVITEIKRVKTEKYLIESEFEYKNLFDSSRDGLLLYDLESSKIVLCNASAVTMFGYPSHKEILKQSPLDLSSEYQPDGSKSADHLKINQNRAKQESIYISDWVHIRKNGEEFHSEVTLTPINFKGSPIILANVRDITDRLKVESELKVSEESFDLAINEAGLGIWDFNVDTKEMIVGGGFNEIIGRDKFKSRSIIDEWLELIHPEDIPRISKQFESHIEGTVSEYRIEFRVLTAGDRYSWVQVSGRAIERDDKGVAKRLVGIIMDIDSTKRLSKEVEDARNFLRTIISSIEAILFVKDVDGKYLLANKSFTDKFGLGGKEIIGKTGADLKVPIDSESTLSDEIVIQQGVEQTYEQEIRLRDGKLYDYLITKIPIKDKEGKIYAQVGLATDITHIKKLEKDLRNNVFSLDAAVNGTGNGLWDWNPKLDELVLNDNWFSILGYTRSQFYKKYRKFGFKTFSDHVHPEDQVKVQEELEKHFAGESEYYKTEIRMLTVDNQWKWILASGKVWEWDEDSKPLRMVGIHIDIDYRVRIEEQLKQALLKAEESDRLKSSFLANMSHEIRTPMNGIIGFLDLLESDDINPGQRKEYMNIIRSSSSQLLNIVNDIVDISKIEAGQVSIRETTFDLNRLFEDLKMQYRPAVDDKNLYFDIDCKLSDTERTIISDHTKLRQILSNLLSNAIKFTNSGGITVSCERDGEFIRYCVADTGIGVPGNLHKKVFERFVQAEMGFVRLQEGTGLGLSICKAYVEKLGGRIWLESEIDKGSKFYFTAPFKIDIVTEPVKTERTRDEIQEGLILIVEDEIYNFLFVEQILQNYGLRVLHAETGLAALDIIGSNPDIGMVLMDIRLPGIDGYETTRRIKEIKPGLPVVALTALALSGDREKALEAGCDDYLKKPVLREELITTVEKVFTSTN